MNSLSKIQVKADSNERPRPDPEDENHRMKLFGRAVMDDPRFDWRGYDNLDVDLQFYYEDWSGPIHLLGFNVELKEPADYVASALGPNGHLYSQVLTMREAGDSCMVLVLGSDEDITNAIKDATKTRYSVKKGPIRSDLMTANRLGSTMQALGCRGQMESIP